MSTQAPAAVVARHCSDPQLPSGDDERFVAHGIMGLAFASGHYLTLRDMSATSIGPAYRAVWHRDPIGSWSIFTTVAPELSCPRYFGAAARHLEQVAGIDVDWTGDDAFTVRMGSRLHWQVSLGATVPTRMMSAMGAAMPARAWRSALLLGGMGPMAGATLRLRSALIAGRLADRLGLAEEQRATVYYATLVIWIGCHADSQEYARWFGDDIAVRSSAYLVDWSGLPYLRFLLGSVALGEPPMRRAAVLASLLKDARGQLAALIHSHCTSAAVLAGHLGLSESVQRCVAFTFERYDGGGLPTGSAGEAIPIEMRVAQLADLAEVHHRLYGTEGAIAMARSRRGGQLDPAVVDVFVAEAEALVAEPADPWTAAMRAAPDGDEVVTGDALDGLLMGLGDFADLKCPFALGHSPAVAELAGDAGRSSGLGAAQCDSLRRAGHVHDLGRLGVSNSIWSKPGPLSAGEWERVRMHPYMGRRVLARIPGLAAEAEMTRAHHEHLDGSGYPLGVDGAALSRSDRVLAAAVAYRSALEPRPYREALPPDAAVARLHARVRAGHLDPDAVAAVVAAAGHRAVAPPLPAGLTRREAEVLALVARGLSNRQIADALVLSEKTVRNHVERTYAKIGVGNRVGASLYALRHGLADPSSGTI